MGVSRESDLSKEQLKKIGERIGVARTNYTNKTQKQVAEDLDIKRPNYTAIENGKRKVNLYQIIKLAELFNVSVDYLVCLIKEPSSDITVQDIYKKYGLTEKSLENLENFNKVEEFILEKRRSTEDVEIVLRIT